MLERNLILLVDDNEANSMLATTVLELSGFDVAVATAAQEAREVLARSQPALILMDWQLPEMDGLMFTRQLKSDPSTSNIPVVALTAHAMSGDRERALNAGCSGYLSKPIDTRTFGDQVRELLMRSRGATERQGAA